MLIGTPSTTAFSSLSKRRVKTKMASTFTSTAALICLLSSGLALATTTCDSSSYNTTITEYPVTVEGTTVFDIANATNRGVCDIGRLNLMADVTIIPNVGQTILIPGQVCDPDNTTCLIPNTTRTNTCIYGGPRLYYTVNGDTYDVIARRLDMNTTALIGTSGGTADAILTPGQFVKVPLCDPSQCLMQPYKLTNETVYLDLAREYNTTVAQIMMLSPTYNYSTSLLTGATEPSIVLPMDCEALSSDITVIT